MTQISAATAADLPELRRVAIQTQLDTFGEFNTAENMNAFLDEAYNSSQLERELTEAGSAYFVARVDGVFAGFLRLRQNDEAEQFLGMSTIELQRLYVMREFQGQKVGRALMQKALEHARAGKFEWIWLGVWERNFKAQEFYARWGFTRFSEHVFQMGDDPQTDWLLKLKL